MYISGLLVVCWSIEWNIRSGKCLWCESVTLSASLVIFSVLSIIIFLHISIQLNDLF